MVLHNNKWDRRAKYKYLKKHGLSASDVSRGEQNADALEKEDTTEHESTELSEPEVENGAESIVVAPDLPEPDELDPKLRKLFLERSIAAVAHDRPMEKTHLTGLAEPSDIQVATAGVERSKLNRAVRERFGNSVAAKLRKNPLDLDSDSDFDEFMDKLDEHGEDADAQPPKFERASASIEINKDKQDFLDKLVR